MKIKFSRLFQYHDIYAKESMEISHPCAEHTLKIASEPDGVKYFTSHQNFIKIHSKL